MKIVLLNQMCTFIEFIAFKVLLKSRLKAIRNSVIHHSSKIESGCNISNVYMGKYSFCGYNCDMSNCEIGAFCSIASNVKIGGGQHPVSWVSTSPVFYKGRDSIKMKFQEFERELLKRTSIGNDVWIGEGSIIKQGVKIGDGAVIGMGSVVTKDIDPYSIVGGTPAKLIRYRFSQDIINQLIDIQWWNLDKKNLLKCSHLIKDPISFINYIKNDYVE